MDSLYNAPGFALNTSKLFALHATNYTIRSSRNTHNTSLVTLRFTPHSFQRILPASRFPLPASHFTYHKSFLHVGNLTTFQTKNQIRQNKNFSLKEKKTLETPLEPLVHKLTTSFTKSRLLAVHCYLQAASSRVLGFVLMAPFRALPSITP